MQFDNLLGKGKSERCLSATGSQNDGRAVSAGSKSPEPKNRPPPGGVHRNGHKKELSSS